MTPPRETNPNSPRPPLSGRLKLLIASILLLTLAGLTFDRNRPRLGTLRIQAEDDTLPITIHQGPRQVLPPSTSRSYSLPPGSYEVTAPAGHSVTPPAIDVRRGQTSFVRVSAP